MTESRNDPSGQTAPRAISVIDPLAVAMNRLPGILFKPFRASRWFGLGFLLFMTTNVMTGVGVLLAQGGNLVPVLKDVFTEQRLKEATAWYEANLLTFWVILVVGLLVVGGLLTLLSWLRSRGIMMFLHGAATGEGSVPAAWAASRVPGNSLFLWRIVISTAVLLGLLVAVLVLWVGTLVGGVAPGTPNGPPLGVPVWALVVSGALGVLVLITGSIVNVVFDLAIVPMMYIRGERARPAWRRFRRELLPGRFWLFVGYIFFHFGLQIAANTASQFIMICTCCLALVPYLGSVLLLPALLPLALYRLAFYQQFGTEWATLPVEPPPATGTAGDAPPTDPLGGGPVDEA